MPWADPEKNEQAVRNWRAAHPGYSSRYDRTRIETVSRYALLDEDLKQQRVLYGMSHRKDEHPEAYRQRERQWIQATAFWSGDDDGSGSPRRRTRLYDEERP